MFLFVAAGRPGPAGTRAEAPRWPWSPLRPPEYTLIAAPCGVLAHIGGRPSAASGPITIGRWRITRGVGPSVAGTPCGLQFFSLLAGRRRAAVRHLEGETEARQVLARMVIRIGELGQAVIVRAGLLALV